MSALFTQICYGEIVKKLSLCIYLVLMWCNVGFTNDITRIEDIKINGISIGDNLLDHFSKSELIQNKKLLEVDSVNRKLYYTSTIEKNSWYIFHYESNERVGMTEQPVYRIIGITSSLKHCKSDMWDFEDFNEKIDKCFNKLEMKELNNSLKGYFLNLNDWNKTSNASYHNFSLVFENDGCYSENAEISYSFNENFSDTYWFSGINLTLHSLELEQILFDKNC